MATTKSTQYELIDGTVLGRVRPDELHGRVRLAFFQHTCESEAIADTIKLTKLPSGSRILGVLWASEDLSAGAATLEIGDSGDTDRLVAGFDVGTAALAYGLRAMRSPTTETPGIGFGYRLTAETDIIATVAVAALNTGLLWGCIIYTLD